MTLDEQQAEAMQLFDKAMDKITAINATLYEQRLHSMDNDRLSIEFNLIVGEGYYEMFSTKGRQKVEDYLLDKFIVKQAEKYL